jgi:N-acyl-D-aspartate/D-glutamate deacylase
MTYISSAFFNVGWRERRGIDYGDLELPGSGERLTESRFATLRSSQDPHLVLVHLNPDSVVDEIVRHPLVMIASDGIDGHPRNAGTFSRFLGRQVRGAGAMSLIDAIDKLSLKPAQRLELSTSAARRKGRVQEGADADIVIFDAETIEDRSSFESPGTESVGVTHLIVAGAVVVRDGMLVNDAVPGRALLADARPATP